MKSILFTFLLIGISIQFSNAQIKVASDNNVGIGVETPVSKLSVGNSGNTSSKVYIENTSGSGSSIRALQVYQPAPTTPGAWAFSTLSSIQVTSAGYKHVGLYSYAYPSSAINGARTYGIYALAGNGESGYNYGIYTLLGGTRNGTAILACAPGKPDCYIPGIYAGYFRGKVYIEENVGIKNTSPSYPLDVTGDIHATGTIYYNSIIQTSDESSKTDIKTLEPGSLEKVKQLSSVTYKYKVPENLISKITSSSVGDTGIVEEPSELPNAAFYDKEQIGFIAQDLQKVFPELVDQNNEGTLGINYIGLIPVLVDAIKEQEMTIAALKNEVELLKSNSKIVK